MGLFSSSKSSTLVSSVTTTTDMRAAGEGNAVVATGSASIVNAAPERTIAAAADLVRPTVERMGDITELAIGSALTSQQRGLDTVAAATNQAATTAMRAAEIAGGRVPSFDLNAAAPYLAVALVAYFLLKR